MPAFWSWFCPCICRVGTYFLIIRALQCIAILHLCIRFFDCRCIGALNCGRAGGILCKGNDMTKQLSIQLLPHEATDELVIRQTVAAALRCSVDDVSGYYIVRSSLDARARTIWVNLTIMVWVGEPAMGRPQPVWKWQQVHQAPRRIIIVGAGPAGLFAALRCIELGMQPIVLERGKDVRARRRDLAAINKEGEVNPESNYCFGEGGAGTYSDGKLYTRSSKRGNVQRILELLVHFGAHEAILHQAHPHIGTNKLPQIITAIREHILACGGQVHFGQKVTRIATDGQQVKCLYTADGTAWQGHAYLLATGHSARDVFELLHAHGIAIEAKPFALGVRIEHPQQVIDACQYHLHAPAARSAFLPPAAYSLVHQAQGRGVFSFCMCPGGIIAPAATAPEEIVVNGWSPSKRNNPFANSGMVVEVRAADLVSPSDFVALTGQSPKVLATPLGMMHFQQYVERKAYVAGGGRLQAPAQRVEDFIQHKASGNLPQCSYLPGVVPADIHGVLPPFVSAALREGLVAFGKKMKGYRTNEALLVATESRTSSPVRIPRHKENLHHVQLTNLYPCAEGAGYAGGIVSAAMDGENCVQAIYAGQ